MYDILWNLHYFCGLNHTKSILADLFPNYTEEKQSIRKFFRSYVYPAMFNMVVMALYNIVDRIFIGQGAGALAICGLALTLPCVSLLSTVGTLTGVGAAARISTSISLGNRSLACRILGNATVLNILLSTILIVYSLYHLDFILDIFGGSGQTIPYARKYMSILIPASLLTNLNFTYCHAIRASGFSRKSMTIVFAGVIANIILDPIFIFGFGLGIEGAAIATALSMCISSVLVIRHFRSPSNILKLQSKCFSPRFPILVSIVGIGMAAFIMNITTGMVNIIMNRYLENNGGDYAIGAFGSSVVIPSRSLCCSWEYAGMQSVIGYFMRRPSADDAPYPAESHPYGKSDRLLRLYNRRSIRSLVGQSLYFRSDSATTQRRGAAVYFSRHAPVRVSTDRHQLFPVDPAGT